jgi:hypothetical protein
VLPVAILGSRSYDVTEIDASSLLLEGEVVPLRGGLEEREDGTLDLTLKFSAAAVAAALGGLRPGQSYEVSITGAFGDGTPFVGSDTVVVARSRRRSRTDQP